MKNCKRCGQLKPLDNFAVALSNKDGHTNTCKPCIVERNRQYWRTPEGRISQIYAVQQVNSRERGHPSPAYTREELTEWAFAHGLPALHDAWKAADYEKDLIPSVDRLDDARGYSFDNIRLVAWKDNNEKMYVNRKNGVRITRQNRRVEQLTVDGEHVAYYPSIALAARKTGVQRTNINAMCMGRPYVKSVGGFVWRHA